MAPGQPKMSLLVQFDDVCRYIAALEEGFDDTQLAFIKFVNQQEECRRKWAEAIKSQPKRNATDADKKIIQHWKSVVAGLEVDLQNEQEKSAKLESTVNELNQVLAEVKRLVCGGEDAPEKRHEILEYLSRLPQSQPAPKRREESLDCNLVLFDKTDDDLDLLDDNVGSKHRRPSGKRSGRKEENSHTPPKRQKSNEIAVDCEHSSGLIATTTVTIPPSRGGRIIANSKIETIPHNQVPDRHARSDTEIPRDDARAVTPSAPPMRLRSDSGILVPELLHNRYLLDAQRSQATPLRRVSQSPAPSPSVQITPIRQCISTSKLSQRIHHFASKTVIRPETCSPCGRKIKFYKQALKCADCRATCHPECKGAVPMPCIPVSQTPTHAAKSNRMTVADFAPSERPMVPALIIHCVNEVESRGMKEVGLYRISGSERDVKDLKLRILKGKTMPNLSKIDVHVMCGVLKDFLRSIETLIPRIMWQEFISVLDVSDLEDSLSALYHAISHLPTANRDTLAFLVTHWQRIAEIPEIKMPISNLSSILAPTIVGYSMASLPETTIAEEQVKIQQVMQRILNVSSDYWHRILNPEMDNTETFKTPDARPPPEGNILGPVYGSGAWSLRSRGTLLGRTPLSPRVVHSGAGGSLKSRKFFASPVLR